MAMTILETIHSRAITFCLPYVTQKSLSFGNISRILRKKQIIHSLFSVFSLCYLI